MNTRFEVLACLIALALGLACMPGASAAEESFEQGNAAFQRGALEDAAAHWEAAARAYEAQGNVSARISALSHLARAQSELGQYVRAAQTLGTALQLAQGGADRQRSAHLRAALGNVHIALGAPQTAEGYLQDALRTARDLPDPALAATILNHLGNLMATQQKHAEALTAYRESIALASSAGLPLLAARARLNASMVLRDQGNSKEALALLDEALKEVRALPASHEVAFTVVSVGLGYRDLRPALLAQRDRLTQQAGRVLTYAGQSAEAIGDRRTAAYAWGYLGGLYEEEQRHSEALDLTRRAIFSAQQTNAPESLYRWQWQAGRLLYKLGEPDQATESYRRAVRTLQGIRPELSMGYGPSRASFRESIGNVYFELVDLLLRRARTPGAPAQTVSDLVEARETVELFKAAELRDYFRDDCVDTALSKITRLDVVAQSAVVIYPILLPDRMELLVSLPSGLKSVVVPVGRDALTEEVRQLRRKLEKRTTRQYLPHARTLYSWLIGPLEADLAQAQVDTLVFVPDGPLLTIPMAALHDGQRFLVAKYAIAITPGLALTDPRPIRRDRTKVLAVGVTESVQGFAALPSVSAELDALRRMFDTTTLLNRDFVVTNLERNLKEEPFSVLHVASHGEFDGEASKSFLLTFDARLTMEQLDRYIGLFKYRDDPLELLALSACETAQGDDRAALGLAGVAVRAGARSALATMWQVHDMVAAELVTHFYRELRDPSASRAVALQRAQLEILSDPRYEHPGYWAAFLMINSWL